MWAKGRAWPLHEGPETLVLLQHDYDGGILLGVTQNAVAAQSMEVFAGTFSMGRTVSSAISVPRAGLPCSVSLLAQLWPRSHESSDGQRRLEERWKRAQRLDGEALWGLRG